MALDPQLTTSEGASGPASVVAALSVYVEPLVADARVAVLGDGELGLYQRLLELGARSVHLYDPDPERVARIADEVPRGVSARMLRDDFDVRDGAFDLVVIPDVGVLPDAANAMVRLRRVVDPRGAVVAMSRARTASSDSMIFPELAPATIEYAELYDLFALQFESVTMTGVLPFRGVVFAELGAGDDLTVSVDTRLVDPEPPGVFVVVASREEDPVLDPYAIVQISRPELDMLVTQQFRQVRDVRGPVEVEVVPVAVPVPVAVRRAEEVHEAAAAYAAMHLKAEMLAQQLDEQRSRLLSGDQRAAELEEVLASAQQALALLENRLVLAEQSIVERDEQITGLKAFIAQRRSVESDELAQLSEAHAHETAGIEGQLRERAIVIAAMEKELDRREQLVRELVASLEEARENTGAPLVFEAAPSLPGVAPEEVARLRRKLDELALEVARRDGELTAQTWRITELENLKTRPVGRDLDRDLAAARDELDALRQALTQEHAARVAAESGEELVRARAELARQGALLEQIRGQFAQPEG